MKTQYRITFDSDEETVKRLKELAKKEDRSVSSIIRMAIDFFLIKEAKNNGK